MANMDKLKACIERSGLRNKYILGQLGLSVQGYYNKLGGKNSFTLDEATKLSEMLHLSSDEKNEIFLS